MRKESWVSISIGIMGTGVSIGLQIAGFTDKEWGIAIIWLSVALGVSLIWYGLRKGSDDKPLSILPMRLQRKARIDVKDHFAISNIESLMAKVHGHTDHWALLSEARDGVLVGDLLERNCTLCGKPRNQKGDKLE